MEMKQETLRLWNVDGRTHQLVVTFASSNDQAWVGACYQIGCALVEREAQIVCWSAFYEPPNKYDAGNAQLGNGRIDLDVAALRGIGLGSLLMRPLVSWIKSRGAIVPLAPINLAADDAKSSDECRIRNRFYEKLGFKFKYEDACHTWGESRSMFSSELIVPKFCLSREWSVESIDGTGEIF